VTLGRWAGGRSLWLTASSVVLTTAALYLWWWLPFDGPWAPINEPRYVQMHELLPIIGGATALFGIQPRLDWVELQSPRPLAALGTLAAGLIVALFAFLPLLVRWLWSVTDLYVAFMPAGSVFTDPRLLADLAPPGYFVAFGCNIVAVLALACLTTALVGRTFGPVSSILWFAALLVAQGHLGWNVLASVSGEGVPLAPSESDVAIATGALVVCLFAYYRSAAGARSVVG